MLIGKPKKKQPSRAKPAPGKEFDYSAIPIELDPNLQQRKILSQAIGARRFAWNIALDWINSKRVQPNAIALINYYNQVKRVEIPWWDSVSKHCFESAFQDLAQAFKNFFKNPIHFGRPVKKKKNDHDTCRLRQGISISGRKVKLPVCGKIRYKNDIFSIPLGATIQAVTLSKVAAHYYCSILIRKEVDIKYIPHPDKIKCKGIDSGLKSALIITDGTNVEFIKPTKPLKKAQCKLKRAQRALCKAKKGSKNRAKQRRKLAKIHHHVAQMRRSAQHANSKHVTLPLDNQPWLLGVEDVAWNNLIKNHCLAQSISDVAPAGTIILIEYKALKYGGLMIKIGRYFPSSKQCSGCGNVKKTLTLGERTYHCELCGLKMDRDENAARNIRVEAMRIYRELYFSRNDQVPLSQREAVKFLSKTVECQKKSVPLSVRDADKTGHDESVSYVKIVNNKPVPAP